jgi:hypothetical protein
MVISPDYSGIRSLRVVKRRHPLVPLVVKFTLFLRGTILVRELNFRQFGKFQTREITALRLSARRTCTRKYTYVGAGCGENTAQLL